MAATLVGVFAALVVAVSGFFKRLNPADLWTCAGTMVPLISVGLIGASLHIERNLVRDDTIVGERFIRGAPMMASLLFANMGVLGFLDLLTPEASASPGTDPESPPRGGDEG